MEKIAANSQNAIKQRFCSDPAHDIWKGQRHPLDCIFHPRSVAVIVCHPSIQKLEDSGTKDCMLKLYVISVSTCTAVLRAFCSATSLPQHVSGDH